MISLCVFQIHLSLQRRKRKKNKMFLAFLFTLIFNSKGIFKTGKCQSKYFRSRINSLVKAWIYMFSMKSNSLFQFTLETQWRFFFFFFFHLWQHEIPDNLNAWLCNPESRLSLNEKKICSSATYHSTDTHLFIFIVWNISHILQIMSLFFLNSHWLFLTNCNIRLNCKLLETESVFYSTYYD